MKKQLNIYRDLRPELFWDVDFMNLDAGKHKRLIIERVFMLGTSKEIMTVVDAYGKDIIIHILTNLNYIDPKTLNFISVLFNIPLKSFKCYKRKQSYPSHWSS